jgi:hypothetical protein
VLPEDDPVSVADLTIPPTTASGLREVLEVHAREFDLEYCWVREGGVDAPFAVLCDAKEFRRLKRLAGEPIGDG